MGIKISQGFTRTGKFPIDEALLLTKAQMLAINESLMPDKYFTLCLDDGKFYIYDVERTPSLETGKFAVFEGGSSDYNDLINQPTLEGKIIKGDLSLSDFGILSEDEVEDLVDSKITDSEGNYIFYTKDETYTKEEVNELIEVLPKFEIKIVEELPTKDISGTTIYLLRNTDSEGNNFFDEYIYINNRWELIGTTKIDLSDYYTSVEVDSLLDEKQDILSAGSGINITGKVISIDDTEVATKDDIDKLTEDLENLVEIVDSEGNRIDLLEDLISAESDRIDSLIEIVDSEGNRINILESEIDNLEIPYFVTTTDSEGNSIVNIISGDENSSVSFGNNNDGLIISVKDGDKEISKEVVSKEYVDEAVGEEHVELTQAEYDALPPDKKLDGTIYFVTDGDDEGSDLPPGGTTGQVLAKKSDADGDVEWKNLAIPEDSNILTAPDGSKFKLKVANDGSLSTEAVV